jgi:hypothetical protein
VDNRQLKKDQVEATRTRRAADNGFDLAKVDKQLHDFVKRDGDMEVSRNIALDLLQGHTTVQYIPVLGLKCIGSIKFPQ